MLDAIGAESRETLIEEIVPASILRQTEMNLPSAVSEQEALAEEQRLRKIKEDIANAERERT